MLITRKIGKILRGKATFTQVILAALLGGMLGFVPGFFLPGDLGGGFLQAPGLILGLLFLVLVLNANLAVFSIVTLLAKLLSLVTLPLAFGLGRWLLDGPLQGLFKILVNSKVTAWFGFEYYATSGGLALGAIFGLVSGLLLWKSVQAFRRKMADLQENSERYQKLTSKKGTRFMTWVLFGGDKKGKLSYREVFENQKKGLPIRVVGIAIVAVLGVGLWFGHRTLAGPMTRNALQSALEGLNGATSDVAGVELDLGAGRVRVNDVAVADANTLDRDQFRAKALEIDIGTGDLLRKRFVVENIVSAGASHGLPRSTPAKRISTPPPPPPPPPGEGKTIEDYIKEAQVWKQRLTMANEWFERITKATAGGEETKEEREVRIEREKQDGVTKVRATHLLERTPLVLVKALAFDGVDIAGSPDDKFDIRASNLASEPALLKEPMQFSIQSKSGRYGLNFSFVNGQAEFQLAVKDIDADVIGAQLKVAGQTPIKGGKLDASMAGKLSFVAGQGFVVDLPLAVTLRGTTLSIHGLKETPIETLTIPLGIRGPIVNPRITVDDHKLADSLLAAGRAELANQVRARADALLKGLPVPGVGNAIGDLIEGKKTPEQLAEEAKKLAEEEAKRRAAEELAKQKTELEKKAAEELKKRGLGELPVKLPTSLPSGLGDLFGGKKKDG